MIGVGSLAAIPFARIICHTLSIIPDPHRYQLNDQIKFADIIYNDNYQIEQ
jgi:hypothetical protein